MQARLRILQIGLMLFFAIVCVRLAQVQVVEAGKYRSMAQKQYQAKIVLPAKRGMLYDRNGNIIASNSVFVSFAADPKLAAEDARAISLKFSKLFGKPKKYYSDKLKSDSRFVWLERQVNADFLKKVDRKNLEGIVVREEPKRLYHNDQVAGQLVGFTDVDNVGLAGMELKFNEQLRGTNGYVMFQRDGRGQARPSVDYPRVEPMNGHSVQLSIDIELQAIAEKELKNGVEQAKADRGIVVIMQPKTGEVLAIGQYPTIDPNNFGKYAPEDQKLRAVTDVFEPGSVFKIVTASAALENHLVKPSQKFFAENGRYVVLVGGKARPIVDVHPYGWLTFQEGMEVSSNIVMAKASDVIGSERFYKMARDYGFGIATNIDYPGEVKGNLKKPVDWSGTTLNTISYGYEVGATPLQITAAYCALANGGMLMKPMLVMKEMDASGKTVKEYASEPIRRVVSEQTATTLKEFFRGVVERGTGKPAHVEGMSIGGKTGTSKKFIEGKYTGTYVASFVGMFPLEDPQIVCLVMLDNPRGANYTGGMTSAPVFRSIAEHLINTSEKFAPPASTPAGSVIASDVGVNKQASKIGTPPSAKRSSNMAFTVSANLIPDVRGLSVRRAISILRTRKLEPAVTGSGTVISQSPLAGQPARAGMRITLVCQPRSLTALKN